MKTAASARAAVPSGASTGIYEACELRDGDKGAYLGKGVLNAVANVNDKIAPELVGMSAFQQRHIDDLLIELDGTENKNKLGANAILGVSLAVAKAAAIAHNLPLYRYIGGANAKQLPVPMANIINGGKHADNKVDFQEFMVMPVGATSFQECIRQVCEVFHSLKISAEKKPATILLLEMKVVSRPISTTKKPLNTFSKRSTKLATKPAAMQTLPLPSDCASSELWDEGDKKGYKFWKSNPDKLFSAEDMVDIFKDWCDKYPIISIEDPLDQDDKDGYITMTKELGDSVQIVGDDYFVNQSKTSG